MNKHTCSLSGAIRLMSTMVKNFSSGHGDFATSSVHMFLHVAVARAERVAVAGAEGTKGGGPFNAAGAM